MRPRQLFRKIIMPIRFSTEAANADHLNPDAGGTGAPKGTPQRQAGGSQAKARDDQATAGKPGKDINAAGFLKDKDPAKP